MNSICSKTGEEFEITGEDLKFYETVGIKIGGKNFPFPAPTLSPAARMQRRLSFRNERNFYHRKCDLSGKQIISMYSADKPYKVYDQTEWWSDKWDGTSYGQDFDFSRPFFEQFAELMLKVPRISLNNKEPENSEYCNFSVRNKNCYLLFTSAFNEDCSYSNRLLNCRDIFDSSGLEQCELCYEVIDSSKCFNCAYLENCSNCSDCTLGYDLKGCRDCFACFSLANKQYHIGNKPYSKEEYFSKVAEMKGKFESVKLGYRQHLKDVVRKYYHGFNIENCTGDNIANSKNAFDCFEVQEIQDCRYVCNATKVKDCYDAENLDNSELIYECIATEGDYHKAFCDICWFNKFIFYCNMCFNSQNLFGCVGLKKKEYCILNKQYSKEEYEELLPKIIKHMQDSGEWGQFFPMTISPFAYNETMANIFFPMTKDEVLVEGLKWHEDDSEKNYKGPIYEVPEKIEDVSDDVLNAILKCEVTGKLYKINAQELRFHRKSGFALPKKCPDQRYFDRIALRNPRKLYERNCDSCGSNFMTSYSRNFEGKIYCEQCYQKEIY